MLTATTVIAEIHTIRAKFERAKKEVLEKTTELPHLAAIVQERVKVSRVIPA